MKMKLEFTNSRGKTYRKILAIALDTASAGTTAIKREAEIEAAQHLRENPRSTFIRWEVA